MEVLEMSLQEVAEARTTGIAAINETLDTLRKEKFNGDCSLIMVDKAMEQRQLGLLDDEDIVGLVVRGIKLDHYIQSAQAVLRDQQPRPRLVEEVFEVLKLIEQDPEHLPAVTAERLRWESYVGEKK
jgi:predicted metal-dependent TIM-barrel fold hydrolase